MRRSRLIRTRITLLRIRTEVVGSLAGRSSENICAQLMPSEAFHVVRREFDSSVRNDAESCVF